MTTAKQEFLDGFKLVLPILVAPISFSFITGAKSVQKGLSAFEATLLSGGAFAMQAAGAVLLVRAEPGPVSAAVFATMPVAVLIAAVAPAAFTHGMPEAIAGATAVPVGPRAPMAVVIVVAMATVVAMRHILG